MSNVIQFPTKPRKMEAGKTYHISLKNGDIGFQPHCVFWADERVMFIDENGWTVSGEAEIKEILGGKSGVEL